MKRMFVRSKIKISFLRLSIIGIMIATFFWFSLFSKRLMPRIKSLAIIEGDKYIYNLLYSIVNDSVKKFDKNKFLIFKNDQNGELVLTQYNMDEIYKLIDLMNKTIKIKDKSHMFFIPSGMVSKNFLLNSWGNKIPIMAKTVNNMYINFKTKVHNYGINNALVEIYVIIEVKQQLLIPFAKNTVTNKYEMLVSSYFINGRVPGIYGKNFEISSNIFDIKTKI